MHAVSVGEVLSALPLLRSLREQMPSAPLFLSTATVAGRNAAVQRAQELVDGIFYAPLDYAGCVRRTLNTVKPSIVIVLETELWPNLFVQTKRYGAVLALLNARISNRTWPNYFLARGFFQPVLGLTDLVWVQSETDRERYLALGVNPKRLGGIGNLKYDAAATPERVLDLPRSNAMPIWIAASTVGPNERGSLEKNSVDEDDVVIEAFQELAVELPRLLLILAPRQPDRFAVVAEKLHRARVPFIRRTHRDTDPNLVPPLPGVILLDTIGELARIYWLADVVFVGGSLAARGGHNILEPAAARKAIVVGPHMENFAAMAADFLEAGAIKQIQRSGELAGAIGTLLREPGPAQQLGEKAYEILAARQGVSSRMANQLRDLMVPRPPAELLHGIGRVALGALAWLWTEAGILKRVRGEVTARRRAKLPVPVVSVGGITMGGSGKTPFCDYLAAELRNRGKRPAILTRGYGRRSPARTVVLKRRMMVSAALTGDEAQIFLRSGNAEVAIGSDRYESALHVLSAIPETDMFLLDDGFQHAKLRRDLDVVLIDGLDPFGGQAVFPLGRLREPLSALRRADAFVVTRVHNAEQFKSIRDALGAHNERAPVFAAQMHVCGWRNLAGQAIPIEAGECIAAFCGLGNPQSFWRTLRDCRLNVVFRWEFADHHQYKPTDIQRLAHQARSHGVRYLGTTEKDSINLPANVDRMLHGVELVWLRVRLSLTDPESFFSYLEKAVAWRR